MKKQQSRMMGTKDLGKPNYNKREKRHISTKIIPVNFLPRWKHDIVWKVKELWYTITKKKYMICQGCGEGISKWKIRNPNKGHGNEYFNCCDGCVSFYDFRFSRMKIIGWEHKRSISIKW